MSSLHETSLTNPDTSRMELAKIIQTNLGIQLEQHHERVRNDVDEIKASLAIIASGLEALGVFKESISQTEDSRILLLSSEKIRSPKIVFSNDVYFTKTGKLLIEDYILGPETSHELTRERFTPATNDEYQILYPDVVREINEILAEEM